MATEAYKNKRIYNPNAKAEFLSLKEEVDKRRKAGYTVRYIYEGLKADGHLCMSYSSFSNYVRISENDGASDENTQLSGKEVINETLH